MRSDVAQRFSAATAGLKACATLSITCGVVLAQPAAPRFDIILRHGTVIDGTGLPRYRADVGMAGGYIAKVGDLSGERGATDIDEAVERLRGERAIDDARVAEAIARTETSIRRRGKLRVRMQIQRAGIGKDLAKRAVDEVFSEIDDDELIEASLRKRLRDRETIADDREFQRLYRYLVGQGFETDKIMRALMLRKRK